MAEDTSPPTPPTPSPSNVKPVWIVTPEDGLHQVPTSAVSAAISNGKGREATARDLAIAGVTGAPGQEN